VIELSRTGALLRYRAARDRISLLERPSGKFQRFLLGRCHRVGAELVIHVMRLVLQRHFGVS